MQASPCPRLRNRSQAQSRPQRPEGEHVPEGETPPMTARQNVYLLFAPVHQPHQLDRPAKNSLTASAGLRKVNKCALHIYIHTQELDHRPSEPLGFNPARWQILGGGREKAHASFHCTDSGILCHASGPVKRTPPSFLGCGTVKAAPGPPDRDKAFVAAAAIGQGNVRIHPKSSSTFPPRC